MELNTCDRILEQQCEYHGVPLHSTDSIADPKHCQDLCGVFGSLCQYWVFQKKQDNKHDCLLFSTDERDCAMAGGPKTPPIKECTNMGNILL